MGLDLTYGDNCLIPRGVNWIIVGLVGRLVRESSGVWGCGRWGVKYVCLDSKLHLIDDACSGLKNLAW